MTRVTAVEFRWLAVIPAAVAGAMVAQIAVTGPAYSLLNAVGGSAMGDAWWIAKAIASPFMGAAFVAAAWLVAPTRTSTSGLVTLGAVAVWSGWLVVTSLGNPGFPWITLLGVLGFTGALVAYVLLLHRGRRQPDTPGYGPHFM